MDRPYLAGLRLGVGSGLVAALVLGAFDVALAAGPAEGMGFLPAVLGLWGALGLVTGLVIGLVVGAMNATWGEGPVGRGVARLRADAALDITIAAGLMAAAVMLIVVA